MDASAALLLLVLSAAPPLAVASHDSLSSAGTEFVVSYYRMTAHEYGKQMLYVSTPETHNVHFSVSDGTDTFNYTVAPNSKQSIDIRLTLNYMSDTNDPEKGILISSSDGISELVVMGYSSSHVLSTDVFTVFPSHHYGSYTYFGVSTQHEVTNSFLLLVGTEDNTHVTITPTQRVLVPSEHLAGGTSCPEMLEPGTACTIALHKLETLLLHSKLDVTGTKVVSDKPLSVFSGHQCAAVPRGVGNCEFLVEHIPPVATWGKKFLIGSLKGRDVGEVYKVVSSEANTRVDVYCVDQSNTYDRSTPSFELLREGSAQKILADNNRICSVRADKPVLVMLFAPNDWTGSAFDKTFLSVVPPVKQFTNSVTVTLPDDGSVTTTLPVEACPTSQCSVLINGLATMTSSVPIYCSLDEVCGYAMNIGLPAGVHQLRLSNTEAKMGVISYAFTTHFGYGTVSGMDLNHIAVRSPEVVVSHNGTNSPLVAGASLVLTCSVSIMEELSNGIMISTRWLRGEEDEEIRSGPSVEVSNGGPYRLNHTFEALSIEDSNTYTCEASLSSHDAGLLTTASQSLDIRVEAPVTFGYFQLLFEGVTKCSEWMLSETADKADKLIEEVVTVIQRECGCSFLSEYISNPTLQCPSADPDSSNEVLFRASVQEGGSNPTAYSDVTSYLEAARGTSFSFKGFLLTISSKCSVKIDSLQDPPCTSDDTNTPCTGSVSAADERDNVAVIVSTVVVCVVVLVLGLAVLILVGVTINHRHGISSISNLRPKSIHLHQRMMPAGDSVTSFGLDSGRSNSNIYVQKDSTPSSSPAKTSLPSPSTVSPSQNGFSNVSTHEQEQNFEIMKTNLSQIRPPSMTFSDV